MQVPDGEVIFFSPQYFPNEHNWHWEEFFNPFTLENVPAGQPIGSPVPSGQYIPSGHKPPTPKNKNIYLFGLIYFTLYFTHIFTYVVSVFIGHYRAHKHSNTQPEDN